MTSSTHVTSDGTEIAMTLASCDKTSNNIVEIDYIFTIVNFLFFKLQIYATPAEVYEKLRKSNKQTKLSMRRSLVCFFSSFDILLRNVLSSSEKKNTRSPTRRIKWSNDQKAGQTNK